MLVPLEKKVDELVRRIPELIRNFDYRKGRTSISTREPWRCEEANTSANYWVSLIDTWS